MKEPNRPGGAIEFGGWLIGVFAMLGLGVATATGQTGVCVQSTQQVYYHCQSCDKNGCYCTGDVWLVLPAGGGYGQGQLYNTVEVGCCSSKPSTLQGPYGTCYIHSPLTPATSRRRVFARNSCRRTLRLEGTEGADRGRLNVGYAGVIAPTK
jgi:hypothetical protein